MLAGLSKDRILLTPWSTFPRIMQPLQSPALIDLCLQGCHVWWAEQAHYEILCCLQTHFVTTLSALASLIVERLQGFRGGNPFGGFGGFSSSGFNFSFGENGRQELSQEELEQLLNKFGGFAGFGGFGGPQPGPSLRTSLR